MIIIVIGITIMVISGAFLALIFNLDVVGTVVDDGLHDIGGIGVVGDVFGRRRRRRHLAEQLAALWWCGPERRSVAPTLQVR